MSGQGRSKFSRGKTVNTSKDSRQEILRVHRPMRLIGVVPGKGWGFKDDGRTVEVLAIGFEADGTQWFYTPEGKWRARKSVIDE